MSKCRFVLGAGISAAALSFAPMAFAQCDTTPGGGAQTNNDDCTQAGVPNYQDPNGGCNFASLAHQDLGNVAPGGSIELVGTVGTVSTDGTTYGSRDLDWCIFHLTGNAKVSFHLQMNDYLGNAIANTVFFIGDSVAGGTDCPATFFYGQQVAGCDHQVNDLFLTAGYYRVVVTVPFEATGVVVPNGVYQCPAAYKLDITTTTDAYTTICSNSTDSCVVAHAAGGCSDFGCCEVVCGTNSVCCFSGWDQNCIDDGSGHGAVPECGYFIYTCPGPDSAAPANDCAPNATTVNPGDTVAFDNTDAHTDGNNGLSSICASNIGKDLWYMMKAPTDGELTVDGCSLNFDSVIMVYDVGTNASFDPTQLNTFPAACADDTCGTVGGPSVINLVGALANHYYLIRIGGWFDTDVTTAAFGTGPVHFAFQSVIFNPGVQKFVTAVAGGNVNLGLSSGDISATQPQRWLAMPFTAATPPAPYTNWLITDVIGKGFIGGGTVDQLCWAFWKRNAGNPAPVAADQLQTGCVALPTPFDDPNDSAATASYPIHLPTALKVNAGNYYLTLYGDDAAHAALSNWAWFIYATGGVQLTNANGAFAWRSNSFPAPGFAVYTALNGVYVVQAGDDQKAIYTTTFVVLGVPDRPATNPCPGDLNNDGIVNGADLGILIGHWGSTTPGDIADLNNDGIVNGADLGILIGHWGNCP